MTEIILRGITDRKKLDSIINFLKSWDIDVEIKTNTKKKAEKKGLFEDSFGMWENRDIDIKAIRQRNRKRRTETYGDDTL